MMQATAQVHGDILALERIAGRQQGAAAQEGAHIRRHAALGQRLEPVAESAPIQRSVS